MIKAILILITILGLLSFAYIVMTATPNDRYEYRMWQMQKERKKND